MTLKKLDVNLLWINLFQIASGWCKYVILIELNDNGYTVRYLIQASYTKDRKQVCGR